MVKNVLFGCFVYMMNLFIVNVFVDVVVMMLDSDGLMNIL